MAENRRIKPTRERKRQAERAGGSIEEAKPDRVLPGQRAQFVDAHAQAGQPFKVVDTLDAMARAGKITKAEQQAGEKFREDYELAGLTGVRALPFIRASDGTGAVAGYSDAQVDAMRSTARALDALGRGGPLVDLLVAVLGYGASLNEWRAGVPLRKLTVSRMMVEGLGILRDHYGL